MCSNTCVCLDDKSYVFQHMCSIKMINSYVFQHMCFIVLQQFPETTWMSH